MIRNKKRKIYKGQYVERVRIYIRLSPEVAKMLDYLAEKYFPNKKKRISLTIKKLILDAASKEKNLQNRSFEEP